MKKICFKSEERNAKKFQRLSQLKRKLRVTSYELKALKHELKSKSASSNPRVTSSNPRVTSSNPWVTSSNPWVTSSNLRVTSTNPRIIKSMKTRVNSLKISSFPKIINPKLFGWLSKWKKWPKFSTEESPRYFFLIFNAKLYAVPFNYFCQALKVSPHRINGGLSDNGCSSVPLVSA